MTNKFGCNYRLAVCFFACYSVLIAWFFVYAFISCDNHLIRNKSRLFHLERTKTTDANFLSWWFIWNNQLLFYHINSMPYMTCIIVVTIFNKSRFKSQPKTVISNRSRSKIMFYCVNAT